MLYRYVIIDGNKYVITAGSYIRKWIRAFSSQLAVNLRLNFVDRGPGLRTYSMTLLLNSWAPGTLPYQDGITKSYNQQRLDLEASYAKIAEPIQFVDPFGDSPGPTANYGVYFTNLSEVIPNYATVQKPYILMDVELTEATQVYA